MKQGQGDWLVLRLPVPKKSLESLWTAASNNGTVKAVIPSAIAQRACALSQVALSTAVLDRVTKTMSVWSPLLT